MLICVQVGLGWMGNRFRCGVQSDGCCRCLMKRFQPRTLRSFEWDLINLPNWKSKRMWGIEVVLWACVII
jgi:hypothetical protein